VTGTVRISRAKLRAIEGDNESEVTEDRRSRELTTLALPPDAAMQAIREVFGGTGLPRNAEKVRMLLSIRAEVHSEWQSARNSFLAIGRALVAAEEMLTPQEARRLRDGTERLFPFSKTIASQLRQVARAVDSGRLPEQDCPGAYSVAYQITLLNDPELDIARDRGLIRPDVTRSEVITFRHEMQQTGAPEPNRVVLSDLRAERRRLIARRRQLAQETTGIGIRVKEIDRLLGES
jgi:hypothetical protein